MFDIVYAEENPLWILFYFVIMVGVLAVLLVLGAFYLLGVWGANRIERWANERNRRELQSRPPLR
jgi:hypothetical protein